MTRPLDTRKNDDLLPGHERPFRVKERSVLPGYRARYRRPDTPKRPVREFGPSPDTNDTELQARAHEVSLPAHQVCPSATSLHLTQVVASAREHEPHGDRQRLPLKAGCDVLMAALRPYVGS